jgi:predicted RNA-binding Zn-ribbon protein involved in translation (DUF1610 family)
MGDAVPSQLTSSDVEAFISERCADFRCPACGGTTLESAAEGRGQPIALLYENSAARSWFGPPGYLRVFALNCASCSYVILFKIDAIERWAGTHREREASARRLSGDASAAGPEQPADRLPAASGQRRDVQA